MSEVRARCLGGVCLAWKGKGKGREGITSYFVNNGAG